MVRPFLIVIFYFLSTQLVLSQRHVKDSLLNVLEKGAKGIDKVDALNQLAYQFYDYDDSVAFIYANQALAEAIKIKYPKGIKNAYTMVGLGYASKSMHQSAILNYKKSYAIKAEDSDNETAYNLTLMGVTYRDQAMFDSAVIINQLAIKNIGNSVKYNLSTLYKNLAIINVKLWQNEQAIKYLDSAAAILRDYPDAYYELDVFSTYGQAYQNLLQFDKSRSYFSRMCSEAQKLEDYYHQIKCLFNKAQLEYRKGNFPSALKSGLDALALVEIYTYPPQKVDVLILIGTIYIELGDYDLANKYLFQALRITEKYKLIFETAQIYNEIAWIYKDQRNYPLALNYTDQSQTIREKIGDRYGVASCQNVRGLIFLLQKKYQESLSEHEKAKKIRLEIKHPEGVAASIFNMSLVYVELKDIDKALSLQKEAIAIEEGIENTFSVSISYNHLADLLIAKGRLDEAEQYLERSRLLAIKSQSKLLLRNNAGYFADLYEVKGDYKKALTFRKEYQSLNDSVYSEGTAGKLAEMQALYQVEKKDNEIVLLNNERALQESQLKIQRSSLKIQLIIIVSGIISFLLVSTIAFNVYRNSKRMRKLNMAISEQNEEIQAQAEELSESNQVLTDLNLEIVEKNEEIQAQSEELIEANQSIAQINKNLEVKVDERTTELKQAYKELDTFFYRASHDFRRPLTTFMGLAEVAKITIKDQNALELFSKVNDTAHYLDKMLVKLQSISDMGGQELVYKEIFFKEIFDSVCDAFHDDIHRTGIKVFPEIKLTESVYSYAALIRIIIENLVENSIFFSRDKHPVIQFKVYPLDGDVVMEVQDNGEGIPDEYMPRIFEMYFRGNERSKGNGLGLYIVKKAVEKLNGEISVVSDLQGTIFTVRFPTKQS